MKGEFEMINSIITKKRKFLLVLIVFSALFLLMVTPALANNTGKGMSDLLDSAKKSGEGVVEIIDKGAFSVLTFIRNIGVSIVVLALLFIFITIAFAGGNPAKLTAGKVALGALLIGIIAVFKTEWIALTIFKLFGIEI